MGCHINLVLLAVSVSLSKAILADVSTTKLH